MVLHGIQIRIGSAPVEDGFVKDTGYTVTEILKLDLQIRQQISGSPGCHKPENRQSNQNAVFCMHHKPGQQAKQNDP